MSKNKKIKIPKHRNMVAYGMIFTVKGGPMHDRRDERGGDKNEQQEFLQEIEDEDDSEE